MVNSSESTLHRQSYRRLQNDYYFIFGTAKYFQIISPSEHV